MNKWLFIILLVLLGNACNREKTTIIKMDTSLGKIRLRLYDETVIHKDNMMKLIRGGFYNGVLFHRVIKDFMVQAGDPDSRGARSGIVLGAKDCGYTLKAEILPHFFHKRGALAAARESDNINPERNSSGSHFYIVQGKVFTEDELDEAVENINNKRYIALFNQLKTMRQGEITKYQIAGDYEKLMQINRELSDAAKERFAGIKLVLSEEQQKAYTTVGGAPHLDGEYTVFGEVIDGMEVIDKIASQETDEQYRPLTDVVIHKIEIE